MNPQAPSQTGLAQPAAPTGQIPVSPNGAPGVPGVAQGTIAPAQGVQSPTSFNTQGMSDAIANYYQIPRQTAQAAAGVEGNRFNATTAYEGGLQAQSQFAKEQLDPGAYKIQQTANGLQILDPVSGQPVDTNTFSNRTGSEGVSMLVSAAAKSANPRDQQFASDYQNFEQYMNAAINAKSSPAAQNIVKSYEQANPQLKGLTPQQAAQMFNAQYGEYLGVGQSQPAPNQALYTPQLSQQDLNYFLEKTLFSGQPPQSPYTSPYNFNYLGVGGPSTAPSVSSQLSSLAPPTQ